MRVCGGWWRGGCEGVWRVWRGGCEGVWRVWREFRRSDGVGGTAWGLGLDRQRGEGRGRKKAFPPS